MDEFLKALGQFFGLSIISIGNFFAWSFVVLKLYTWFLLPVFVSLPEITYWEAMGIWVASSIVKGSKIIFIKDEYLKSKTEQYIIAVIAPWMVLLIGLIIK